MPVRPAVDGTGIARVMTLVRRAARDPDAVEELLETARVAGCDLGPTDVSTQAGVAAA